MVLRATLRNFGKFVAVGAIAVLLAVTTGCGQGGNATVAGKVTAGGQPVSGGSLTFAPVGGGAKPASAVVNADGTYDLSSSGGAAVGKTSILYSAPARSFPPGMTPKPGDMPPASPYDGMKASVPEVDIQGGSNTIDIELVK